MYGILPNWVKFWLLFSTVVCAMDVAFTMLRPDSFRDGPLGDYFPLWHIYADVDLRYGNPLDPVTRATGILMCVELALNDICRAAHFHSLMAAFTASALVFWKTSLYLSLYIVSSIYGGQNEIASGTPFWNEVLIFWVPNSVWVFVPLLVMICLWQSIQRGWRPSNSDEYRIGSKFYQHVNSGVEITIDETLGQNNQDEEAFSEKTKEAHIH